MKNMTQSLSVKIEKSQPLKVILSVRVIVKLAVEGTGRQCQPRTWKGSRRRSHSWGHAQQDLPGQSQRRRRSLQANVSLSNIVGCRGHILMSTGCLGGAGSNKENVAPLSPQSIPTGVADNVSGNKHSKDTHAAVGDSLHVALSQTQAAFISSYIGRLRISASSFSCGRPFGGRRMTLRRLLRTSSSDTRRSWTSGLQAEPLRRESEQGPLLRSPGDLHG